MTRAQTHRYLTNRIIDRMTENLIDDFGMNEIQAMDAVYNSKLYEHLLDPANQLYIQSADHLYEKLLRERCFSNTYTTSGTL